MEHILVVEDEAELAAMLQDYLGHRGYRVSVAHDGAEALRLAFSGAPDLVVLDLNLPVLDGIEVARTLRSQTELPIIMTTARSEEEERLDGFAAGADDYLTKPFSLPELAARIAAVLRRGTASRTPSPERIVAGDLVIDRDRHTVTRGGRPRTLTAAQFAIVSRLAAEPGRVFTRLQLLESFQEDAWEGYERSIDVHIKNIRRVLEDDPARPSLIVTVRGVGYRMETADGRR